MILYYIFLLYIQLVLIISAYSANIKNYGICQDADKTNGYCKYGEDCPKIKGILDKISDESITANELEYIKNSSCGNIKGKPLICCTESLILENKPMSNQLPTIENCPVSSQVKLVGGNLTNIDEYPWMAVLLYTKNNVPTTGTCTGNLITNRYVLTAAHCVNNTLLKGSKVTGVRLGEWDKSTDPDCMEDKCAPPHQDFGVEYIIVHEDYDIKNTYNDIALIRLDANVKFSAYVNIICLPITPTLSNANLVGNYLDVSGWGKTEYGYNSDKKLKAGLPIISSETCNSFYIKYQRPVRDTQLCAGGEKGIDSCKGDSGGPLIGIDNSKTSQHYYYLAGIVSYGLDCGIENIPAVYTRVGSFIDWISNNIKI